MTNRYVTAVVLSGILGISAAAQTVTPNLNLTLPSDHQQNWGPIINNDLSIIDTFAGTTGTVKTITVGSLSPYFTSAVAGTAAIPAITYTVVPADPHTFLGNTSDFAATPIYIKPSFSDLAGSLAPSQLPGFSGDVTSSAGSSVLTLATVNTAPGLCGDATHVCSVTTNAAGLVTSQAQVSISGLGSGTVTSVAMTVPAWLSITGSPITTNGTLALAAAGGQAANSFLATPSGSSGPLGVRAIVAADLPLATLSAFGAVKCDGTTITCTAGVVSTITHGTITGSGTNGFIPLFNLSSTAIGNSHIDDGITTASVVTSSEVISAPGLVATDSSGVNFAFLAIETPAPSGIAGKSGIWDDSTSHRFKMNNANSGVLTIPGISTAGTSGHCVQFGASGFDLVDAGAACGSGGGGISSITWALPSFLAASPTTLSASGTQTFSLATQTANRVFAGPTTGSAAAPTFRAIVAADLPLGTTSAPGALQPDGTTITVSGGIISAVGGGGGIANVQITLPTTAISANTCTAPATVTMTGLATTSTFSTAFASDPAAITGWGSSGGLAFASWPTSNTAHWEVCNVTSASITPGAMTINLGAK